jgi:hypothetical protein
MKKILALCIAISLSLGLQAQTDLSIQLANYTNGQSFSNDTIKTEFIISNLGTTMFHTGDTLYVNARLNGDLKSLDLMSANATPIILTGMLHNGDTMHYNPGVIYGSQTLPFFPGDSTLEVCMIVWGKGIATVGNYGSDANTANNISCATYDPSLTTGVQNIDKENFVLSIYPNPVSEQLFFELKDAAQISSLQIVDINGHIVERIQNPTQSPVLNVSSWSNGFYFYQLQLADGKIANGKIVVSH